MGGLELHAELGARPLMELDVMLGQPLDLGQVDGEGARMVSLTGGTVSGGYQGRILPGGADWQTVRSDGTFEIRARYVAELTEGLLEVRSNGVRFAEPAVHQRLLAGEPVDASDYYFRTAMRFRTAAEPLLRLNHVLAIAVGERRAASVHLRVFEIV